MVEQKNNQTDKPLQSTLDELQKAFESWNSLPNTPAASAEATPSNESETAAEVRRKTQEILAKLNEQIKDWGF